MRLDRITLAANDIDAMVAFYNNAFDCALAPLEGSSMYRGELAGVVLVICPNDVAGVVAEQNRHQLRLEVDDIGATMGRVMTSGGVVMNEPVTAGSSLVAIADPDGNTYELIARHATR